MNVFMGVDGGGSKTEIAAVLEDRSILAQFYGGSTNPYAVSPQSAAYELEKTLESALDYLLEESMNCHGICLGMSGIYSAAEKDNLMEQINRCLERKSLSIPIAIRTEGEISLMAATGECTGVLIIAGTGSIVYGFTEDGRTVRTGGWGHLLGDEGSGYQIGLDTLQGVMRSHDKILPPTLLTSLIKETRQLNEITELRSLIYQHPFDKKNIAAYAKLCIHAAEQGDPLACSILKKQARNLADTAIALLQTHSELQKKITALTGSIFLHSSIYQAYFTKYIRAVFPDIEIVMGTENKSPAYGAALLAQRLFI
ncbi:N-acetylglucosamine kinase [Neobacillus mesonae]|nr:N-acetylglucosamine kinase [Neobacillus mesonae]